ncbi:MAG: hypothetical protein IKN38_10465, partial [Clostridia bacterium]|nr:hypothetical protein [Clostridia bacterium]
MKIKVMKILSVLLCMAIALGGGALTFASDSSPAVKERADRILAEGKDASVLDEDGVTKEETVYVITDAEGKATEVISSCHLNNPNGVDVISDNSTLDDIENVKGDEEFVKKNGKLEWRADGSDIYYRGTSNDELPVEVKVSYTLDGKKVSPDKIAGASGKVTVRFDYKNNVYEKVDIDGKEEKIFTPFALLSGMILDNDVFRNVEVTNGKAIDDGDRTAVIGIAFPGMQ